MKSSSCLYEADAWNALSARWSVISFRVWLLCTDGAVVPAGAGGAGGRFAHGATVCALAIREQVSSA
eukprot:7281138-Prymnesium_polylepis.1